MNACSSGAAGTGESAMAVVQIRRLLARADDLRKAAPGRSNPGALLEQVASILDDARSRLPAIAEPEVRREQAASIARRVADLDLEMLVPLLEPTADVARAPSSVNDPSRVPPGQHLTAGWPVLHVGAVPDLSPADVRLTVTGQVRQRTVLDLAQLQALPGTSVTRDLHCVTRWSRLDNT